MEVKEIFTRLDNFKAGLTTRAELLEDVAEMMFGHHEDLDLWLDKVEQVRQAEELNAQLLLR